MEGFYLFENDLKKELPSNIQKELLISAKQGNIQAKNKLFEHNLLLIKYVVNKYYMAENDVEKEDLLECGAIGLWEAIEHFDINSDNEFSTFAIPYIWGTIKNFKRNTSFFRLPNHMLILQRKIIKLQKQYSSQNEGKKLSNQQLANILKTDEQQIKLLTRSTLPIKSFSEPLTDEVVKSDLYIEDVIEDIDFSIDDHILQEDLRKEIQLALSKLKENERKVIELRFGLNGDMKTQKEIAGILNLTRQRIAAIEKSTITKIINYLPKDIIEEYGQQKTKTF